MPEKDLARLKGAWTLSTLQMDGREMPVAGGIEIEGGRFRAVGMGADYEGTVEIDDSVSPPHLDLVFTNGPEAGNRNRGVYELDGDTLRLCLNFAGKARPKSFAAPAGSGNALEVFHRGISASDEAVVTEAAGEGELVGEWQMVNAWQEGYALDPRMVKTGRRVTTSTRTTTYFGKQVFRNASYRIDATAQPKTVDLTSGGQTQLGIYDVDGDINRVCFAAPGRPRPTEFESHPGDGRTLAVWKRVKAATAAAG